VYLVLGAVSVVPDLDVAAFPLGIPYEHPLGHRGFFHSLPFALVLALPVCLVAFRAIGLFSRGWWILFGLTFAATASHGLLDTATDAGLGIGLLVPFSMHRFFLDFRPIETSSVNPLVFLFQKRSLEILASEILWVWIPVLALSLVFQAGRRWRT
jgi:inner membrane protein